MKAYMFRIVVEMVEIDEFGGVESMDSAVAKTIDPARCGDGDAKDVASVVRSMLDEDAITAKVRG